MIVVGASGAVTVLAYELSDHFTNKKKRPSIADYDKLLIFCYTTQQLVCNHVYNVV